MKHIFSIILAVCLVWTASANPAGDSNGNGPRLIVRADDMGSFRAANIACMQGIEDGIISDIEVMVVTSWFPEAARLLCENPHVDVGLHLTLTSEWDNNKWRPLTECPSLCDENGYLKPQVFPNRNYPGKALTEGEVNIREVEREMRAQIEMALRNIPHISHISCHMMCSVINQEVSELLQKLGEEYNLPVTDSFGYKKYEFNSVSYMGPKKTSEEKEASFIAMLESLEPGKTYMFLDHPALDNEEMQTVSHIGYEDVAVDRQGVTDTFTSEKVKQVIKERGIELIGFKDLF